MHRPLGGEVQLHGVLCLRGSRLGARVEDNERPQEQQQRRRQRQPRLQAQRHLGLTLLANPRAAAQQESSSHTSSRQTTAPFSPFLHPPAPPSPSHCALHPSHCSSSPPPPLIPTSLHAFPSVAVRSTYEITHTHLKGADMARIQAPRKPGKRAPCEERRASQGSFPKHSVLCALVATPLFSPSRSHSGGARSSGP